MIRTVSATLIMAGLAAIALAQQKLPPVPEGLAPLKARVSGHSATKMVTLSFSSSEPLTEEQWKAVASVPVKGIAATGKGIDDSALAQLAKLPLEGLLLEHARPTDVGAANFAQMKSLKILALSHTSLTGKAADALAEHPTLEAFSDDGKVGGQGMAQIATCRKLRTVRLMHGASNDASAIALAKHPAIEELSLNASNAYGLTDAALPAIASIPGLKNLTITDTVLSFDGGLSHLKEHPKLVSLTLKNVALPDADLAQLKAAMPGVKIAFEPMPDGIRKHWDFTAAKRAKAAAK